MRLQDSGSEEQQSFARWLMDVGHGRQRFLSHTVSTVVIPEHMQCRSKEQLISSVYGTSLEYTRHPKIFRTRAILAPRNEDVVALNDAILDLFPGPARTYDSADCAVFETAGDDGNDDIPLEILNSFHAPGFPPPKLTLKAGCPVILLRNPDSNRGLCNGTRGTVLSMTNRVIEIRIMGGEHDGQLAFIPRISLIPSIQSQRFTMKMKRRQFPLQLAFAITIISARM
jgi:hypothetical protein